MELRLLYEGSLHSQAGSNARTAEKHAIRKALHPQLREAWNEFPFLRRNVNAYATETSYHKFGFHFIPLVNGQQAPHCRLDILFLRRDAPGNLIRSGGDLDNRMKVLFDGLKMPSSADELGSATPGQDENPFFVLTEDDSLITEDHDRSVAEASRCSQCSRRRARVIRQDAQIDIDDI